jgi:NAD(P)-dependent dehydrogenase (short-subunit alcohol dehydrogenase family)
MALRHDVARTAEAAQRAFREKQDYETEFQIRLRDGKAAGMSPFNRIGDPRDVADVVVFLATDAARWVTGQNIGGRWRGFLTTRSPASRRVRVSEIAGPDASVSRRSGSTGR